MTETEKETAHNSNTGDKRKSNDEQLTKDQQPKNKKNKETKRNGDGDLNVPVQTSKQDSIEESNLLPKIAKDNSIEGSNTGEKGRDGDTAVSVSGEPEPGLKKKKKKKKKRNLKDAQPHLHQPLVRPPINLEVQCGVIQQCRRSLMCKSHGITKKVAVEGRSRPFSELLEIYKTHKFKTNTADPMAQEIDAQRPSENSNEEAEVILTDSNREEKLAMAPTMEQTSDHGKQNTISGSP